MYQNADTILDAHLENLQMHLKSTMQRVGVLQLLVYIFRFLEYAFLFRGSHILVRLTSAYLSFLS